MKYEDLSFTSVDENGIEHINDIIKIIPNTANSDEPYVVFTNYTLDENDEFINYYGRLVQNGDDFALETDLRDIEIAYIKKSLNDEIVKYVNDVIEENKYE